MTHSLRRRLLVLIALLCVAGIAASGLMIGLFNQSASAQAGEAEAQIGRACDSIASSYRFYSAGWKGPTASLQDESLQSGLTTVVMSALRDRPGIEGGLWQAPSQSIAYAYPTYQGAAPKTDFPTAEGGRIAEINEAALAADRPVSQRYAGATQVLLLTACPLRGPIPQLTAWTMTRVVTFAGRGYQLLMAGLTLLLATVLIAAALLIRLTLVWSRHVTGIETALQAADAARLPTLALTGEKELDQIIEALNVAGTRLAQASERAEILTRQVVSSDRLAAIGRVAAGVAHEIRNPIAAMRLKAENALLGDTARKDDALSMILHQIERLDRLLKRLLSLTERDPPRREPTDLKVLLETCADDHRDLALTSGLSLTTRVEVDRARIDGEQIRRALDNLVINAIQAAPPHSEIILSAHRINDQLILSVRDQGEGPPPAIREHLFEPFVTGRADGTGLGLSGVREIANAHGGSAKIADSSPGTTFQIILPWE